MNKLTMGWITAGLCLLFGLPLAQASPQSKEVITGKDGAPMVLVSAGEFLYGSDNQRWSLPAFYMDKYEVTTKLYAKFLQATSRKQPKYWNQAIATSVGDRLVIGVTWHDAEAYCQHYGRRLPREQEWEKVIRGGAWDSDASRLQSTLQGFTFPAARDFGIGFRCAQDTSK